MGRKTDLPTEMVDAALQVMNSTEDAEELRRALSVVLSGVLVVGEVKKPLEEKLGHAAAETTVYRMLARHRGLKEIQNVLADASATLENSPFRGASMTGFPCIIRLIMMAA